MSDNFFDFIPSEPEKSDKKSEQPKIDKITPEEYKKINKKLDEKKVEENKAELADINPKIPENSITVPAAPYKINQIENDGLTDLGNLKRFLRTFKNKVYFITEEKKFRIWDGKVWKSDPQHAAVSSLIEIVVRGIYLEAEQEENASVRKKIAKWAIDSESRSRRQAILGDLEQSIEIVRSFSHMDLDPWLFNVQNGTIDLRTGKLQPFNEFNNITKISPVKYDPEAKCPQWMQTLDLIFKSDEKLINYVQRLVGYSMTGLTNERLVIFLYGTGRNGKTSLIETIFHIMGDYARATSIDSFISGVRRSPSGPTEDIARLRGVRMVKTSEASEGGKLDESLIKDLSGGDTITARNLHASSFDFKPQLKLWMFGNYQPRITGQDQGIRDRIKMIPFLHFFEKPDKEMQNKLRTEASGILNWMIEGCLKWQQEGFEQADAVTNMTNDYFKDNDPIGQFIQENCNLKEHATVKFKNLWEAFEQSPDFFKISKRRFSQIIKHKFNVDTIRATHNVVYFYNLELKDNSED